jgi:hypothetical protein
LGEDARAPLIFGESAVLCRNFRHHVLRRISGGGWLETPWLRASPPRMETMREIYAKISRTVQRIVQVGVNTANHIDGNPYSSIFD